MMSTVNSRWDSAVSHTMCATPRPSPVLMYNVRQGLIRKIGTPSKASTTNAAGQMHDDEFERN